MGEGRVAVRPVLADVGRINMLFAVRTSPPGDGWLCLGAPWTWAGVFAGEVARVREHLARLSGVAEEQVEPRVAASVFYQGLATRVLSPVLAAGVCHGVLVEAARLWWDPHREGSVVLGTCQEEAVPVVGGMAGVADWIERTVLLGVLEQVAREVREVVKVAPGLLRGNIAASLAGAAGALGRDRPEYGAAAEEVTRDLLRRPCLEGSGGYTDTDQVGAAVFRRTTCCLYYRVRGGGYCGDCALEP